MDYIRSSASLCEFADADQDRENSHVLPTPAVPPTTAAATPTAPAAATPTAPAAVMPAAPANTSAATGKLQRYHCGRRMSNLFYGHHSVCSLFMGFVGTWHLLRGVFFKNF